MGRVPGVPPVSRGGRAGRWGDAMCSPPGILCLTPSPSRLPAGSRSTSTPTASCLTRRISWPCRWALPPRAMTRTTPQLFGSRGTPLWEAVCVGVVLAWAAGGLGAGTPNPHPAPCWGGCLGGWAGAGWAQHPTESSLPPRLSCGAGCGERGSASALCPERARLSGTAGRFGSTHFGRPASPGIFRATETPLCRPGRQEKAAPGREEAEGWLLPVACCLHPASPAGTQPRHCGGLPRAPDPAPHGAQLWGSRGQPPPILCVGGCPCMGGGGGGPGDPAGRH